MIKGSRGETRKKRSRKKLDHAKAACLGKQKHKSRLAAEYVLNRMNGKDSHLLEIYKCQFCGFEHIGHNKKNKNTIENDKKIKPQT